MRAICILGSPRKSGNTAAITAEILRGLETRGVQTSLVQLSAQNIGYCRGCKACYQTGRCVQADDTAWVVEQIRTADLVIVASPSYWGDVTGQMKAFIDRCTPYGNLNPARLSDFRGVKGAAVAVRAGQSKAENQQLVHTIEHFLGHLDIPLAAAFTAEGIDTAQDLSRRPDILQSAYVFGLELADAVWKP